MFQYRDRREAGRGLGERLAEYTGVDAVVLALPRGGVPVGYEVARRLGAPLDVFVVRKLGVPGEPELAMGALASGGVWAAMPGPCWGVGQGYVDFRQTSDDEVRALLAAARAEREAAAWRPGA